MGKPRATSAQARGSKQRLRRSSSASHKANDTQDWDRWFMRAKRKARKAVTLHEELDPPVRAKIAKALEHGGLCSRAEAEEAAFHLTDWIVELHKLVELFDTPRWNSARAMDVLMAFVIHAPAHLAAAHRTIMGSPVTDVFKIGAVKGSGRGTRKPGAPYARPPVTRPRDSRAARKRP